MKKVLVICGPTASGKTALALLVANKVGNVSIISADSRQVYKGIDVISGKDIPKDLSNDIKFFGIDLYNPEISSNLSEYVDYARKTIDSELNKGRKVIVVGGTGLYLKGITEPLEDISIPNNPELRMDLEKLPLENLQNKLKEINSEKFNKLNNSDLNNPRRLIRHIEITLNKSDRKATYPIPNAEFRWVGLNFPKNNLENLITARVIDRLSHGAIEEVKNLLDKSKNQSLPILSTLGVKEITTFLKGELSRDELITTWSRNEVNYAKRQMVWFKKQTGIIWYDESVDKNNLSKELAHYLNS